MNLLVTGGSGFIGSNFIRTVINKPQITKLVNMDCMTYAANPKNLEDINNHPKYIHRQGDIRFMNAVHDTFYAHNISHVIHFAAESHVDNSIQGPKVFVETNVMGTFNLLECAKKYNIKRFHHVSTDEVYGELGKTGKFKPTSPYDPKNPYSATKAASDFLVRSYGNTFGLNYTLSNCSNNYGPRQDEEKFIPVVIKSLLFEEKIPVYGGGRNIRDWIYVKDHCEAVWKIFTRGKRGETYLVGANNEKTNLQIVKAICKEFGVNPKDSIKFVQDRAGHDFRYAIDASKLEKELNWKPKKDFTKGLKETVKWYKELWADEL
jgi:dTDP-glucose 4,6-dehydratase